MKTFGLSLTSLLFVAFSACNGGGGGAPAQTAADGRLSTNPTFAGELGDVQRAINAAAPGETVTIGAGTFRGRLVVHKSLTLVGAGADTMLTGNAALDDAVIEVVGTSDVIVADLVVSGPHTGLCVRSSSQVLVRDVVATGNGHEGIDVRGSSQVTLLRCTGLQNTSVGLRVREASTDVRIDQCTARDNQDQGIELRGSSAVTVQASTSRDNRGDGVRVRDSNDIDVLDSVLIDNLEYGLRAIGTILDISAVRGQNQLTGNVEGDVRVDV
ncbi:MAG: right-handed parallel beta-helix repeat-containing protein [Planctomycetes bacterium]|nr:right-handed parallel beta-helix repeat-containing protein [Planctomycetota bacterium]